MDDAAAPPTPHAHAAASLRILASGSSGNSSVLLVRVMGQRRICLIDAGLSPRRTERLLEEAGLSMDMLDSVLLTHLDHDHYHAGWATALPGGATLRMHKRHLAAARRDGGLPESVEPFDSAFDLYPGVRVTSAVASHDDLGVASFRFDFASDGHEASLGFATDLGRVTDHLVEHLSGVDVLAIESNYCPHLQAASDRPWFLKRRIMGGSGHLSNEECLRAIDRIGPRSHVVLLHLSRQCNRPDLVAAMHEGADYAVTIAEQERASRWVHIHGCPGRRRPSPSPVAVQLPLFGLGDAAAAVPAPTPAAAAKAPTM